jgi:hypothetical protein
MGVAGTADAGAAPVDNPAAAYRLAWTDAVKWTHVVAIDAVEGKTADERLKAAQERLGTNGGVVYFPAGAYRFSDPILLKDGVVIRGATPGNRDARKADYALATKFEFPRFEPKLEGEGTPIASAFKGIGVADPGRASNCGVVNVDINHGHIDFQEDAGHNAGRNRIVFGCILRNAAIAEPGVPQAWQNPWQRWTQRHHAAIHAKCGENLLIANNRLPESDGGFEMKAYRMNKDSKSKDVIEADVVFDYDFRPGIYANLAEAGESFGGKQFTPEERPWAFRKGIVIRDNYVFCTGSPGILFTGDGTVCSFNVIRFKKNVKRETVGGIHRGHFTNNIRAIEMRGWRWTVEGNDYEVHRNVGPIGPDGEGLMHEAHSNSTIKDSRCINNKGNAYLSFWRTPVDGLVIRGNELTMEQGGEFGAICVISCTRKREKIFPCKNVHIVSNVTACAGISILLIGAEGENNVIANNRNLKGSARIINEAAARVSDNEGHADPAAPR